MTTIYFVRHAKPDLSIHDDLTRPLTDKGIQDSKRVTAFLQDKAIDRVFSSPYARAVDTIKDFADRDQKKIELVDDFRERKISHEWIEDFDGFAEKQWDNFDYKLSDGESLNDVQKRNVNALKKLLNDYPKQNIVIGTHGTSLSTILNYYNHDFDFNFFNRIRGFMPFIIRVTFDKEEMVAVKEFLVT